MKTIEEAEKEVWVKDLAVTDFFRSGVEFAQRWIPVENELPEKYQNVLLKEDSGSIYVGFYSGNSKLPIFRATEARLLSITHWRQIELK